MTGEPVRAYVGLGGNLGSPARQVSLALEQLDGIPETRLLKASRLYRSRPWGVTDQPDFVNAVAVLDTGLGAGALLERLQALEAEAGRVREGVRWGPRVLDLDLLLYGDRVSDDPQLELPHPRMHQRAFVLIPLLEIEPGIRIPGQGDATACLAGLDARGVEPLEGAG